jgi:phage gp36-like protein
MGRYIAQTDLDEYIEDRVLIQLTDDDKTGEVNTDIVDECIAGAEDEVDGLMAGRYTVPFATAPGIITEACVVLACRRLYVRRGRLSETFKDVVDDTVRQLEKIAEGKIILDMPAAVITNSASEAEVTAATRVHTRSKWSGW